MFDWMCNAKRDMTEKLRGCDDTFFRLNHGKINNSECYGCEHYKRREDK